MDHAQQHLDDHIFKHKVTVIIGRSLLGVLATECGGEEKVHCITVKRVLFERSKFQGWIILC